MFYYHYPRHAFAARRGGRRCVTLAVLFFLLPQADAPAAQANAETEAAVPASVGDWGLSFQTEGSRPSATYPRIRSASGDAYYVGDTLPKDDLPDL